MLRIIIVIAVAIVVLLLILRYTKLGRDTNKNILIGIAAVVGVAMLFTLVQDFGESNNKEMIQVYEAGGSLVCRDVEVSKSTFNFVGGTMSFVGKEGKNIGLTLEISDCEIK